jgi:Uncharacterized conserved protein
MNNDAFASTEPRLEESKMRSFEYFHNLRLLPETYTVIRVDGRSFSKFTLDSNFEKPFDIEFHKLMVDTTKALLTELDGIYAFTESDEISILFSPTWNLFDRSVEKLVSISASIASSTFTSLSSSIVSFDSRLISLVNKSQVVDYFLWRQADATRCALNGYSYWTLRKNGESARKATSKLDKQTISFKNELLFENGINFNEVPSWQRRGTGIYWETYEKKGFNPIIQEEVSAIRRRLKVDEDLPMKDAYGKFIESFFKLGKDYL